MKLRRVKCGLKHGFVELHKGRCFAWLAERSVIRVGGGVFDFFSQFGVNPVGCPGQYIPRRWYVNQGCLEIFVRPCRLILII